VHAHAIARALGMRGYICPPGAGVASALGFLTAPIAFEFSRSAPSRLCLELLARLDAIFTELEAEGRATLAEAGVPGPDMRFIRRADLRHAGQGHEIVVELRAGRMADMDLDRDLRAPFYTTYEQLYGHAHPHLDVEITTCRLTATAPSPSVVIDGNAGAPRKLDAALKGRRHVRFPGFGSLETVLYDRDLLAPGVALGGPAIIEGTDSTAVVPPDASATVDSFLNIVVQFAGTSGANPRRA
jgi:N-methylhydantoinase A